MGSLPVGTDRGDRGRTRWVDRREPGRRAYARPGELVQDLGGRSLDTRRGDWRRAGGGSLLQALRDLLLQVDRYHRARPCARTGNRTMGQLLQPGSVRQPNYTPVGHPYQRAEAARGGGTGVRRERALPPDLRLRDAVGPRQLRPTDVVG